MPIRRRTDKRRPEYPRAIEDLLAGRPIERTEQARQELITLAYFGWCDFPELGTTVAERARAALGEWSPPLSLDDD